MSSGFVNTGTNSPETKDLIHEGIATESHEFSAVPTAAAKETKDLIHEGIATRTGFTHYHQEDV